MDVSVIGGGRVGITVAACFAESGHTVTVVEVDRNAVDALNAGRTPIHEPEVDELVARHAGERLRASTEYAAVRETSASFITLPTPVRDGGRIDTATLETGVRTLASALSESDEPHLVAVKSTVVPGTTTDILRPIIKSSSNVGSDPERYVASNPEFLREGHAVSDFRNPDKIVSGAECDRTHELLQRVYEPLYGERDVPVVRTGIREAEMIKYANNAFLATKISLVNEIGNICKEYGIDAYEVTRALGLDDRIGERFLRSGVGWGGSCFPKDLDALITAARDADYVPELLQAAEAVNHRQPQRLLSLLDERADVSGDRVAVLGLSFKPGTDDIRNSRAIPVIEGLQDREAEVVGYDPVAADAMSERFPDIDYEDSAADALSGAHAALIVTDWAEFTELDAEFDRMARPVVIDGRRAIERREGIVYEGLTW